MTVTNVQPILTPNAEQMYQHLEHLFGGDLGGCHDGLIEIAWTHPAPGKSGKHELNHARLFGTDEIEEAVEEAVRQNSIPGQNVYVGAALRKPTSAGRCYDADFLAMPAYYADLDDPEASSKARALYQHCPPTLVVVTGRQPYTRAQCWWRLDEPDTDPVRARAQNAGLAAHLNGDASVRNVGRVMRLAGSIAWPVKPGRTIERTEIVIPAGQQRQAYMIGEIAQSFEPIPEERAQTQLEAASYTTAATDSLGIQERIVDGRERYMRNTVLACLIEYIGENGAVPDAQELFDLAWPQYAAKVDFSRPGRGAEEMQAKCVAAINRFEQGRIRGARTLNEAIESYRKKSYERAQPEVVAPAPIQRDKLRLLDWTAKRYEGEPEPIEWLCDGTVPLGIPVLIAAMGGLGKSYLALDLGLEIAAQVVGQIAPKRVLGGPVVSHGTAVVISAEDSQKAIHRRFSAIDPNNRRLVNPERLIVVPLPDAGGPMPLIKSGRDGLTKTEAFVELKQQLCEIPDLRVVVIDPLQAFVLADVTSDPAAGQFMWSCLAEICAATGATVMVLHHMRKDGLNDIQDSDDAREAIRGSTALVDGARLSYALWRAPETDAKSICSQLNVTWDKRKVVQGAVVKANDEADWEVHTYLRAESGLLEDVTGKASAKARKVTPTMEEARAILREIKQRSSTDRAFSAAPNTGYRYLAKYIMKAAGIDKRAAESVMDDWLTNEVIVETTLDSHTKKRGLKVAKGLP